jgi:hypothetical protein
MTCSREGNKLTLQLDLVLDHQGLTLGVDLLGELGRDGVVGSGVLDDKTLVAFHAFVDGGLLNCPLADVCPFLVAALGVLLGVRRLPPLLPVVGELLKEGGLKLGRLQRCASVCRPVTRDGWRMAIELGQNSR